MKHVFLRMQNGLHSRTSTVEVVYCKSCPYLIAVDDVDVPYRT